MSVSDEFTKLQALHDSGTLTDAEFAEAKAKVLAEERPQAAVQESSTQRDIQQLQTQNQILKLDQEWAVERENYMLHGRYGSRIVPNAARSMTTCAVISVVFLGVILLGANMPRCGFVVVLGILGIVATIWSSLSDSAKADAYDTAYERYQRKHEEISEQLNRTYMPKV